MKILALAALSSAAPAYDNAAVRSSSILQQIQQLNEDGSFTFGYENSDGSYRMENRDASGYVVGRYGYIDAYGKTQEMGRFDILPCTQVARGNLLHLFLKL